MDAEVDAVLSTATFHWVLDHDRLFARLFAALRPGGRLVAQCGGKGNAARVLAAADAIAAEPDYAGFFGDWERPSHFPDPDETADRLRAAGFVDVATWLQPHPVVLDQPRTFLATVVLREHLARLPASHGVEYVDRVLARLPAPATVDYVRLNIDARRPG
jgi:trans-aconitate 2-methyltransferase